MGMVDSYNLKYEVVSEYPYGTKVCDTEQEAINHIMWQYVLYKIVCRVRVVGEYAQFRGVPKRYEITDRSLLRIMERDGIEQK